jgi:hypothetical protein
MKIIRFFGFVIRDALLAWIILGSVLMLTGENHAFSAAFNIVPFTAMVSFICRFLAAVFGWGRSGQSKSNGMSDSEERRIMALGEKIARNGLGKAESPTFRCERCQNAEENKAGYYTCCHQGFMVLATQTCDDHSCR